MVSRYQATYDTGAQECQISYRLPSCHYHLKFFLDRTISCGRGGGDDCAGLGNVGPGLRGRSPFDGRGGGLSERGERLPSEEDETGGYRRVPGTVDGQLHPYGTSNMWITGFHEICKLTELK